MKKLFANPYGWSWVAIFLALAAFNVGVAFWAEPAWIGYLSMAVAGFMVNAAVETRLKASWRQSDDELHEITLTAMTALSDMAEKAIRERDEARRELAKWQP